MSIEYKKKIIRHVPQIKKKHTCWNNIFGVNCHIFTQNFTNDCDFKAQYKTSSITGAKKHMSRNSSNNNKKRQSISSKPNTIHILFIELYGILNQFRKNSKSFVQSEKSARNKKKSSYHHKRYIDIEFVRPLKVPLSLIRKLILCVLMLIVHIRIKFQTHTHFGERLKVQKRKSKCQKSVWFIHKNVRCKNWCVGIEEVIQIGLNFYCCHKICEKKSINIIILENGTSYTHTHIHS